MQYIKKGLLIIILLSLVVPIVANAIDLNLTYPIFPGAPDINCNPGACKQALTDIVAWLYVLIVSISGLAAFVMIVWGGVQWMTSAGNPTKTSDAKDKIQKALLGLLLILASFLIIQVINPELTILTEPPL